MFRLTIRGPGGSQSFASDKTEILLGRRDGVDLAPLDKAASRNHCMLRVEAGRVQLIDLGSVNGTLVEGKRVDRAELRTGESFRIGATEFTIDAFAGASGLSLEGEPAAASAPLAGEALPAAAAPSAPDGSAPPDASRFTLDFSRELRAAIAKTPWYLISLLVHALILLLMSLATSETRRSTHAGVFESGLAEELAPVDGDAPEARDEPELEPTRLDPEVLVADDPANPTPKRAPSEGITEEPPDYGPPDRIGTGAGLATRIKPLKVPSVVKDGGKGLDKDDLAGEQERAREAVSRGLGDGLGRLGGIAADQIVVVGGDYDKMEAVLDLYKIPHTYVARAELLHNAFPRAKVLCINCGRKPDEKDWGKYSAKVREFVARGGWIITSDWAVQPYVANTWPKLVQVVATKGRQPDTTVAVHPTHADSPLLRGVFAAREHARWWLEETSTLVQVVDTRKVDVLVTSDDMLQRFGAGVVVFEFQETKSSGKVLHLLGHFFQKDGNRVGLVAMHRLVLNFLRERLG